MSDISSSLPAGSSSSTALPFSSALRPLAWSLLVFLAWDLWRRDGNLDTLLILASALFSLMTTLQRNRQSSLRSSLTSNLSALCSSLLPFCMAPRLDPPHLVFVSTPQPLTLTLPVASHPDSC